MADKKWSQITNFDQLQATDQLVGLRGGDNWRFNPSGLFDLKTGNWIPNFSNLVGISGSISLISARYIKVNNIITYAHEISFTASDSFASFTHDFPVGVTTNNFSVFSQSGLMGQCVLTDTPTAMEGNVLSAYAIPSSKTISVSINITVGSGLKYAKYSVMAELP